MRVVCAWCGLVLADHGGPVSHGICSSCSLTVERAYHRSMFREKRVSRVRRAAKRGAPTIPLPGFPLAGAV